MSLHVKKGDLVVVMAGKDATRQGKVVRALPRLGRVVVEGINLKKRRTRPKKANEKGQVIDLPHPISVSNVLPWCSRCRRGVRVGYEMRGQSKVRICRRCSQSI